MVTCSSSGLLEDGHVEARGKQAGMVGVRGIERHFVVGQEASHGSRQDAQVPKGNRSPGRIVRIGLRRGRRHPKLFHFFAARLLGEVSPEAAIQMAAGYFKSPHASREDK